MVENGRIIFVTVGSTGFDQIISLITSIPFLQLLISQGFVKLVVQYGKSRNSFIKMQNDLVNEIEVIGFDYKPSLHEDMKNADLIISHAGSGSILEILRLHKPLIVVVNENLMDNHQLELAIELQNKGYLVYSSISNLLEILKSSTYENLTPFPEPDKTLFANILDKEMGVNVEEEQVEQVDPFISSIPDFIDMDRFLMPYEYPGYKDSDFLDDGDPI
ncbi:hypothetical protein RclHR1_09820009 [Rhizophagus clarus]|uniref:UDP-N-acetylglucosamine transferase subunit ALG13 n=1 Tax=Rhizophagus clarus TaxID=94130 RepID=A0A2Z6SIF4_9GLOM|nr:hypothetical protein RclHR1_09820009 [Rhizophagus clarus]GES96515.1 putative bifunctional UDP-N-acetylglucosamine transferase and deubiquitinase ALG13 [Rhizophagus clarus]